MKAVRTRFLITVFSIAAVAGLTDAWSQPQRPYRGFALNGLYSPADVAGSIFVYASPPPGTVAVRYYLDDQPIATERRPPFWLGGQRDGQANGFSLGDTAPGQHRLRAEAILRGGWPVDSTAITLRVVPSINRQLSQGLTPYGNHPSAQRSSFNQILSDTSTPGASLSAREQSTREDVLRMYLNWGIDPSLDSENDQSDILLALAPTGWTEPSLPSPDTPLSLLFSPDAPFYQPIPSEWPKTTLPTGYFRLLQLNTARQGDGIGFGESTAAADDSPMMVNSQWYDNTATHKSFPFVMTPGWPSYLPEQTAGDMHMVFADLRSRSFVSTYKTSLNSSTGGPDALAASYPTAFNSLGDRGGSNASGYAELPILIQPGEATDPDRPIRHALGGSVARTWAARVFPASAWDTNVKTSTNSCTGTGFTNTGLIPYGGVIQLDPALDLTRLHLTLPALRILQAIQTYGYYVMDFGCADIDIYTAIAETELDPYGGLWGYNRNGPGVQNEVAGVLLHSRLSVVVPLTKKQ